MTNKCKRHPTYKAERMPRAACDKCVAIWNARHPKEPVEIFEGKPCRVLNGDRFGWWRFHDHYDRHGYCDNPGRGY